MPTTRKIFDSTHTFVDPVRQFKTNDPYVYSVDNIPIEQLQENCRWLRDQILNLEIEVDSVDRKSFGELKPTFAGTNRTLNVNPGRYTARVNDAYGVSGLQYFRTTQTDPKAWLGQSTDYNSILADVSATQTNLNAFLSGGTMNVNGLEINYHNWLKGLDAPKTPEIISIDGDGYPRFNSNILWPLLDGRGFNAGLLNTKSIENNSTALAEMSVEFIRRWRGVGRTSVVDIPETLSIDIPDFDEDEFFYFDQSGVRVNTNGSVRLDLVFIYTKPVDSDSAHIQDGTSIRTITTPELGIVKGAGLGLYKRNDNTFDVVTNQLGTKSLSKDPADNNYRIANAIGDEDSSTNGFKEGPYSFREVHGSFPSPDDLLNLAPQLLNTLEATDPRLIGQTVLPLCYVVVREPAVDDVVNNSGQVILTNNDVLDIRPFFRTAELTYNERAGIAAAVPQLSLANPAVGEVQLDHNIRALRSNIQTQIEDVQNRSAKTLAKGIIWGGLLYGPEGTIVRMDQDLDFSALYNPDGTMTDQVLDILGFPLNSNIKVPAYPTWDLAPWTEEAPFINDRGSYTNDWMDTKMIYARSNIGPTAGDPFDDIPYGLDAATRADLGLPPIPSGWDAWIYGSPGQSDVRSTIIRYAQKVIHVTNIPEWVQDLKINADYLNCAPHTSEGSNRDANISQGDAQYAGINISKYNIAPANGISGPAGATNASRPSKHCRIVITAFWAGRSGSGQASDNFKFPWLERSDPGKGGYLVSRGEYRSALGSLRNPYRSTKMGKAIYPTIEFEIIGLAQQQVDPQYNNFGFTLSDNPQDAFVLSASERKLMLEGTYRTSFQDIAATE